MSTDPVPTAIAAGPPPAPAPGSNANHSAAIILVVAVVLSLCAGLTCGVPLGWLGGMRFGGPLGAKAGANAAQRIVGTYSKQTKNGETNAFEFKANGLVVITFGRDAPSNGTYAVTDDGLVTISDGMVRLAGELRGDQFHLNGETYTKKR